MTPFDKAVEFVLSFEGGYSNDLRDPGGETKFGISKRSYPDLDIAALTRTEAEAIYRKDYWDKCRCGELPSPLALITFDAAVNQGTNAAIRMLQETVGVKVDGVIGPVTLNAAINAKLKNTVVDLIASRSLRYATNKNVSIYGRGWFRRLAACHQAALEPL